MYTSTALVSGEVEAPDMVQKGFPGDDLLLVFQQIVQQVEFPPGELYGAPSPLPRGARCP